MFIYQVRERTFTLTKQAQLVFPSDCVVRFYFLPLQPFGMEAGGGKTAVHDQGGSVLFNANSGQHYVESKGPLSPLKVSIADPNVAVEVRGNVLTASGRFEDAKKLNDFISAIYYAFPLVLNVAFADPPIVERVDGEIGTVPFRWELKEWNIDVSLTNQKKQEGQVSQAWERTKILSDSKRRRLLAAIHYFHVACRLSRRSETAGEFLAEMVLNLAKCLQALFPSPDGTNDMDSTRVGLKGLGYDDADIEANFIPALVLRNQLGVGHIALALYTIEDLRIVHAYTERAERAFRDMLKTIMERIEKGEFDVTAYDIEEGPSADTRKTIERLRANMPKDA